MADQDTNTNQTTETPPATPTEQQTYSSDYVSALRNESAGYRTRARAAEKAEKAAREAFGLKPGEEIGDISARLAAHEAKALEKANARLITAEIKGLQGYNTALLERLIDRGSIKVGDDGTVTGAKEAAEAAAKQFPEVLTKTQQREQWAPKNPAAGASGESENQAMNDLIRRKH